MSLTPASSYSGNSSDLGLPNHHTIKKVMLQNTLKMVCTLTLGDIKPQERKVMRSNWPKITLMLFQSRERRFFLGSGGENFSKLSQNSSDFLYIHAKVLSNGAQEDLTQRPFSRCFRLLTAAATQISVCFHASE